MYLLYIHEMFRLYIHVQERQEKPTNNNFDKEHVSVWSTDPDGVEHVEEPHGQTFHK